MSRVISLSNCDEFLDDHPRAVAAHVRDGIIPRRADLLGGLGRALALAGARHHRLHHAGKADLARRPRWLRRGISANSIFGRDQRQLARREVADSVAVHGQLHGLGGWRDSPAFRFERRQRLGVDRLDFGDDHVGLMLLHRGTKRLAVEHREDLERVRDLHRGRILVAVAGDDPAAEPLGSDGEFAAEFAAIPAASMWQ